MALEELTEELSKFIPANLRLDILTYLWEEYKNRENLAKEIGCKASTIKQWLRLGQVPKNRHMPKMLLLGIKHCPRIRELLRKEVLQKVSYLFSNLGILRKEAKDFTALLDVLDEKSRAIIWWLWWNRHAEISELAELTEAPTDMEILTRLKEVINPVAKRIFGREIVEFADSRIDPVTGEKVLFSWWLVDEDIQIEQSEKPLIDIFDEKGNVTIIAQLPHLVKSEKPEIQYKNGIVKIKLEKISGPSKAFDRAS